MYIFLFFLYHIVCYNPCTIVAFYFVKSFFDHSISASNCKIQSRFVQSSLVTLNELLSISSKTFSFNVLTISLETNRCVSSKSSRTNFLPNAKVSSKCNKNCFKTASLYKLKGNIVIHLVIGRKNSLVKIDHVSFKSCFSYD